MKSDETINIELESGIVLTATENSVIASKNGEELYRIVDIGETKDVKLVDRMILPDGSLAIWSYD